MSEQDDYAAFQAWKAQNVTPEKEKQSITEELKNWLEGVARHLSHPIPQSVSDALDEQIQQEKNGPVKETDTVEEPEAATDEKPPTTPVFQTQ